MVKKGKATGGDKVAAKAQHNTNVVRVNPAYPVAYPDLDRLRKFGKGNSKEDYNVPS